MFFEEIKHGLIIFFASMVPAGEARLAIPWGIAVFKMQALPAFAWGVLGNITIGAILLKYLEPIANWIFVHSPFITKHFKKYLEKMHKKHNEGFNRRGALLLTTFVALPIPGTGAWSGAVLAYLFNIPFPLAFSAISFGVTIAAIIVTFSTKFILGLASILQA